MLQINKLHWICTHKFHSTSSSRWKVDFRKVQYHPASVATTSLLQSMPLYPSVQLAPSCVARTRTDSTASLQTITRFVNANWLRFVPDLSAPNLFMNRLTKLRLLLTSARILSRYNVSNSQNPAKVVTFLAFTTMSLLITHHLEKLSSDTSCNSPRSIPVVRLKWYRTSGTLTLSSALMMSG